ncbi:MAG: hypothetical protein ACQETH_13425 [Candidatus Rifleibacteriota bacterium]
MKRLILIICAFSLISCGLFAGSKSGKSKVDKLQTAYNTVEKEINDVLNDKSAYAAKVGRYTNFNEDLKKLLNKYPEIGHPKPLIFKNKVEKILVPLNLNADKIGGFFQLSANGKKILSYLIWKNNLEPLFVVNREKWEAAKSADQLDELKELVPLKENYSAGVPVEPSDLTDLFLIDYIDHLPTKTQEELESYTSKNDLESSLGRRTGSSKCLSYSASLASDWWNIAQGNKLGSYDSFVNGAREYGMNPRIVESLYFSTPKCPYAFIKETGHDRVTGEKIPYSPKHYAYIMSSSNLPASVKDPLKGKLSYHLPANKFGLDLPYDNSFNKSKGKIKKITSDLKKYGIIYAQHTSRLFNNKVSLTFQGVHAVNIVGTAKLDGEPVVIYYETFGKNHRDYLEDSFYGPRLRAFPVKFFYQGIYFPHRIIPEIKVNKSSALISFKTHNGKNITPGSMGLSINDRKIKVSPSSVLKVSLKENPAVLKLTFARKYFYIPEQSEGYERTYLISGNTAIEIKHYEAMLKTLKNRKRGFFGKLFGKKDSYTDHLKSAASKRFEQIKAKLLQNRNDYNLIQLVKAEVDKSKTLKKSELGKLISEMSTFDKINNKKH